MRDRQPEQSVTAGDGDGADRRRPPGGRGGRALVVAAHGSHLDPGAVEPAVAHADAIRERGGFREVRAAFWKNEPSLRGVVGTLASDEVVVVPLFTSEGYFVREVVPREVRSGADRDRDDGRSVHLADPVGTHGRIAEVVVERAESVTGDPAVGPGVGLAVVGHGTERDERSARATLAHADRIRDSGRFDEVRAAFMDEPPYVDDLLDRFESRDVVVVPLFVADGYHTTHDIPEALGLAGGGRDGLGRAGPAEVDGHRVWYAGAVGTEPGMVDVILERAAEATPGRRPTGAVGVGGREFPEWVADGDGRTWGELAVSVGRDGEDRRRFALRHRDDRGRPLADLDEYDDPAALRDLARFDDAGRFRPLSGAPTLPTGWVLAGLDDPGLVRAVEWVYPASISTWHHEREGDPAVTHFREAAARQTGIYEVVADASRENVACAAEACCAGCVRRRAWEESEDRPLDAPAGDGAFPCREPCSFLVAAMREFGDLDADSGGAEADAGAADADPEPPVRVAAFDEPGNPYRERFLAAKRARLQEATAIRADWGGR